jgi:hypothetical protein
MIATADVFGSTTTAPRARARRTQLSASRRTLDCNGKSSHGGDGGGEGGGGEGGGLGGGDGGGEGGGDAEAPQFEAS